jgi:2-polyprenyl-3-methyl-5-hydroxy-6-metoxy-1,4-benzoquinol methylase
MKSNAKKFYEEVAISELAVRETFWKSPSHQYFWWKTKSLILEFLLDVIATLNKKKLKILDIGCGIGTDVFTYNRHVDQDKVEFHGFDISKTNTDYANRTAKKLGFKNCYFYQDNAEETETDEKYDVVVCSEVLEHLHSPEKAVVNFKKILKKEGYLIISTPSTFSLSWPILKIFFERNEKRSSEWSEKRMGKFLQKEEGFGHISEMSVKQLEDILDQNGFRVMEIKRGFISYGGRGYDEKGFAKALLIDSVLDQVYEAVKRFPGLSRYSFSTNCIWCAKEI